MNGFLKQSTAAQVRTIGPFIDDTDFKTLENGLTINNTDIVISANGGADTVKNSGGATAHGAGGIYTLTWDATDTAAVGELFYSVKVAGALVVFNTYVVLEEAVYDAIFGASAPGYLQPTVAGRTLDVSAGGEAGLDWANIGSPTTAQNLSATNIDVDQVVASVSGAVGSVTGAVGSVTGLTAATVHSDLDDIQARLPAALTAAGNIKADTLRVNGTAQSAGDIIASFVGLATTGDIANVPDAVWDEATSGHQTAGTTGKALTDAGAAGTSPTAAENADAVWDEVLSGHVTNGTAGARLFAGLKVQREQP